MGFYEELSKYYDVIFPVTEDKVSFIHSRSSSKSRLLDVACGTGGYAIALTKLGHIVDGIDLDKEMIESANEKANIDGLDIDFRQGDMKDILTVFKGNKYDTVFCIGNSLVHLTSLHEIQTLLSDFYKILDDDGRVIIQIVNYNRILEFNIDHLPPITRDEDGVRFIRNYEYSKDNNNISFNTELFIKKDNDIDKYMNSVVLLPLISDVLIDMLKKVGFKQIDLYGSFNEDSYSIQSIATIVVAYK